MPSNSIPLVLVNGYRNGEAISGKATCHSDVHMVRKINIETKRDLLAAQDYLVELRASAPFSESRFNDLNLLVGELADNVLNHGRKGRLSLSYRAADHPYVEVVSENIGALPEGAQEDGFSSRESLGIGLGTINRLSDELVFEQDDEILRIRAIKYCRDFPPRVEVAVLSYPLMGDEKSNGDAFLIHKSRNDLFCVIDALGHGAEAYESATAVKQCVLGHLGETIDSIIHAAHLFIQGERGMRGVMLSIAQLDYERRRIIFGGLGDVMMKIFPPDDQATLYALPKDGIVGDNFRNIEIQEFKMHRGSIVAMFTDGVSTKLSIPVAQRREMPVRLVNELMGKHGKVHDDRTLLLARIL